MDVSVFGSLVITYAVVQTVVFLLLVRFMDLYEREPLSVLGLMALWGAVGATTLSALGNVAVEQLLPQRLDIVFGRALHAPLVEELAKGAALVAFVVISLKAKGRFGIPRFEGVTDGIVYGAAVGLGFAFTEDVLYLLEGASEGGLEYGLLSYLARRDFFGVAMLHHAIYTGAFGLGIGLATWSRKRSARVALPLVGLFVAMTLHAVNNGLVQLFLVARHGFDATVAYAANVVPPRLDAEMDATARTAATIVNTMDYALVAVFIGLVLLWLRYQRRVIKEELAEEADAGLISKNELELIPSYWRRSQWYMQLIRTGQWERWRLLKRIHNELVTFAFLKRRVKEEKEDAHQIDRSRRLIARLKAQKAVFL